MSGPLLLAGCSGGSSTASGPTSWDPRVLPIVKAVEQDRGLTFLHPVKVNFMTSAAFQKLVGQGDASSSSGRTALQQQASELRALGLASGPLDLGTAQTQADEIDTVGYYDTDTKQIYVDGTALTPYVRVTVAHELTHVLQDQHLDLARLDNLPDDQQTPVSALVEGDAVTVENDYENTLSPADQKLYNQESSTPGPGNSGTGNSGSGSSGPGRSGTGNSGTGNSGTGNSGTGGEPDFLAEAASFPYDLGPPFVDALLAAGGNDRVNSAFSHPPTTEAEIADPSLYLAGVTPVAVPAPVLPAGGKQLQAPAAFGQVSTAEVIGTRLGYAAWHAVQGWAGDTSELYESDGHTCVAIDTAFDSAGSAADYETAAQQWAAGLPAPSSATVSRRGNTVSIRACDPGTSVSMPPAVTPAVYDVLVARADMMDQLLTGSVSSATRAECMADAAVAKLGPAASVAWDQSAPGAPTDSDVQAGENGGACPA